MEYIQHAFPLQVAGAGISLLITLMAVVLGSVFGLTAGLARLSKNKLLQLMGTVYVDSFRGTPLFVQIMLVYFGLPRLAIMLFETSINMNVWAAAIISTSLNSGAYIAEIFRSGVQSIEKGQMEAARSLGMTKLQAMHYVILPQAFKRVIPPMGNEFIALLKDTSLLSVIGFEELARKTQLEVARTYASFELWMSAAVIYLVMTFTFSRLVDRLEKRLKTDE